MDAARKNIITPEMEKVAAKERMTPEEIRALVAEGKVAICANKNHKCLDPQGVIRSFAATFSISGVIIFFLAASICVV